ncbi:MAG: leucine-rich repeat domain-containing protein, partial [Clostridia bacterium]
ANTACALPKIFVNSDNATKYNLAWYAEPACTTQISYNYTSTTTKNIYGKTKNLYGEYTFVKRNSLTSVVPDVESLGNIEFYVRPNIAGETGNNVWITQVNPYSYPCTLPSTIAYGGVNYAVKGYASPKVGSTVYQCLPNSVLTGGNQFILPSSMTEIGDNAYFRQTALTNITLPSNLTKIGESAFVDCSNMLLSALPASMTVLGANAFNGCSKITISSIPSGVTSIESSAFNGCAGITNFALHNAITRIEGSAFNNCSNMMLSALPANLNTLGNGAFAGCSNVSIDLIPNGVTELNSGVFQNCVKIRTLKLPPNLTRIDELALRGCTNLSYVKITSQSIISITIKTFMSSPADLSFVVPNGKVLDYETASIWSGYFNSSKISSVGGVNQLVTGRQVDANTAYTLPNIFGNSDNGTRYNLVWYAESACTTQISHEYTPTTTKKIYGKTGEEYIDLTIIKRESLTASAPIQTIPNMIEFYVRPNIAGETGNNVWITQIKTQSLPYTIPSIINYQQTIYTVKGIASPLIGSTVYPCLPASALKPTSQYVFPSTLTELGDNAFMGQTGMAGIVLPAGITIIGKNAFSGCTDLTVSANALPSTVKKILNSAFKGCSNLTLGTSLPNGITEIGASAFYNCINLALGTLPGSLRSLGASAFYNCKALTISSIPSGIGSLPFEVFAFCQRINISSFSSVTSIGADAFRSCSALRTITVENDSTMIEMYSNAFVGCHASLTIYVPNLIFFEYNADPEWSKLHIVKYRPGGGGGGGGGEIM